MPIVAKNNGSSRELIPAGTHVARAYSMVQIGTVNESFNGEEKWLHKVRIGWELPEEKRVFDQAKGEQPLVISKEFTLSMNEKSNLRKILESWRGKGFTEEEAKSFDITKLLGQPCMLNIIHKPSKNGDRVYEEIASVSQLPKSVKCLPQENPTFVLSYDEWDEDKFESLPEFIKEKMKRSKEFQTRFTEINTGTDKTFVEEEDSLPF